MIFISFGVRPTFCDYGLFIYWVLNFNCVLYIILLMIELVATYF